MLNRLAELVYIMPPPETPRAAMGDWQSVAATLGTSLPSDYVAFISRYGTGRISDFLWVYNPFEENRYLNLLTQYPIVLEADRHIRERFPEALPEPLFPESGGLLLWGGTDNGDRLYWRTNAHPDSWTVVVWQSRGPKYANYALTMSGFLCAWLRGSIRVPVFPPDDWEPVFEQNPSYTD